MVQIIIGVVLAAAGLIIELKAVIVQYDFQRKPELIIFGAALQVAAFFFFVVGAKEYYFREIIDELKKLNAPKG